MTRPVSFPDWVGELEALPSLVVCAHHTRTTFTYTNDDISSIPVARRSCCKPRRTLPRSLLKEAPPLVPLCSAN
ncbi:hypothetical protein TanjilG_24335 [Lupinus angustifolius]|uniref:Uncharacterized protein n=1 Tax=Lupinus angustifolius TaxID=3871 RepID=A0A394DL58_LUPAN|nr:hypothetical protein TanjilG_24335 [Lupinus angustifolius]